MTPSTNSDYGLRDRVAKAMINAVADRAKQVVDEFVCDLAAVGAFLLKLKDECDAGLVIIGFSRLDTMIKTFFETNLIGLSDGDRDALFRQNGPLATASGKIQLAKALGWLHPRT